MSLNRIVIMGRLTKDPELRHTQSGTSVASFTLACDRDFRDKQSGERGVDFIDVVAWRQTGEFAANYFAKGRMAVVDGRLQMRVWEDKDGNKRRSPEVIAEHLYFGDSKTEVRETYSEPGCNAPTPPPVNREVLDELDDDGVLPF